MPASSKLDAVDVQCPTAKDIVQKTSNDGGATSS